MSLPDQLGKKLKKESNEQKTDMHPVHIRIRRDDDLIVAQVLQIILNSQGRLNQIEFLVFINDFPRQTE